MPGRGSGLESLRSDRQKDFYDWANRLQSAVRGGVTVVYSYDALSRRVTKTVNGLTTRSLYSDGEVIEEQLIRVIAHFISSAIQHLNQIPRIRAGSFAIFFSFFVARNFRSSLVLA